MLKLNFHHHIIHVRCNEDLLLKKLEQEFHFFLTSENYAPEYVVELFLAPSPEMPAMVASKILENAVVYRMGQRQYIDYFGEALTIWDTSEKTIQIHSSSPERLYELSFLAVHSLLGQALDRDGLARIHAVAVSRHEINALVMLPSKGGKSSLLKKLIETPEVKIISDDMPLCDLKGRIHPFPSKISLDQLPTEGPLSKLEWQEFKRHHYPTKWTASLAQLGDRIDPRPQDNRTLLIAGFRLSTGKSLLTEVSKWKMIKPILEHMIFGLGLPQIIELFLKFNVTDLIKLPYHAIMRSICAYNLVRKSKCYYFYLGPDKDANAQILLELMNDQKPS